MCVCVCVCVCVVGGWNLYKQKCYISKIPHYANMYCFIDLEDLMFCQSLKCLTLVRTAMTKISHKSLAVCTKLISVRRGWSGRAMLHCNFQCGASY